MCSQICASSPLEVPKDSRHPEVHLINVHLWKMFHERQTEMVITKEGRNMFPHYKVKVQGLDPHADYFMLMEVVLVDHFRYKYSASGGWQRAGQEQVQSDRRFYMHPQSPSKGDHWMSQEVSFAKLKMTNQYKPQKDDQIVLSSMHRYQPKFLIVRCSHKERVLNAPRMEFIFPETQFIAVTAYQNRGVTDLKIENNDFARGFRENGKANKKRKSCESPDSSDRSRRGSVSPAAPSKQESNDPSPAPYVPFPSPPVGQWSYGHSSGSSSAIASRPWSYDTTMLPLSPSRPWSYGSPSVLTHQPFMPMPIISSYYNPYSYLNRSFLDGIMAYRSYSSGTAENRLTTPKQVTDFSINRILNS